MKRGLSSGQCPQRWLPSAETDLGPVLGSGKMENRLKSSEGGVVPVPGHTEDWKLLTLGDSVPRAAHFL